MSWINTTEAELKIIQTDLKEIENPTKKQQLDLYLIEVSINAVKKYAKTLDNKKLPRFGFSLVLEQGHVAGLWDIE